MAATDKMTLADMWAKKLPPEPGSEKSDVIAHIIWLEGVSAALEILCAIPEANNIPTAIWRLQRDVEGARAEAVKRVGDLFGPAAIFQAMLKRDMRGRT